MMEPDSGRRLFFSVVLFFVVLFCVGGSQADETASRILRETQVQGGLVVLLGCGEEALPAEIASCGPYVVHVLDSDSDRVEKLRAGLSQTGRYGTVSVAQLHGAALPYITGLVNLVVAENLKQVPMAEVMRVLAPRGVAYVKEAGKWRKTIKKRPEQMDEWTHYLYDATNNAVSHDTLVGPPRQLQWNGSPRWSRHHDRMASCSAMVSAAGRLFYIFDEGSTACIQLPSEWKLIARDAFNGTILWKRSIDDWHPHLWPFKSGPAQLPRRLVAVGDTVYVTLGLNAPLCAIDAATGKTLRTYKHTTATEEVLYDAGRLFCLVNTPPTLVKPFSPLHKNCGEGRARVRNEWAWQGKKRFLVALNAETGAVLWRQNDAVIPLTMTAAGDGVFYHDGTSIIRRNASTGETMWKSAPVSRVGSIPICFGPTLVVYDDVVLFAGGDGKMYGLSRETGKHKWPAPAVHYRGGHNSPRDLLVVGGLAWSGQIAGGKMDGLFSGCDPATGEVKKSFTPNVDTYWFHHRCYRSKATERYLLPSRTGIEFVDWKNESWEIHHWVRGGCIYGIMPANGMVYTAPHDCACYLTAKLYGFCAVAPKREERMKLPPTAETERLTKGPAYGTTCEKTDGKNDWPTYRCDGMRSGATDAVVPAQVKPLWSTQFGGRLSSATLADGLLYVAAIDRHTLYALGAGTGKTVWKKTAGGRIDSPPTIFRGKVFFGSADGYVYCLRASDGELVWRYLAAPRDLRHLYFEQLESVWPVHGSVLIRDGVLYCVAGRSMFLDGGMRYLRLDPETGRKIGETKLDDRDPGTDETLQANVSTLNMPTALSDILSGDDKYVYMRSQTFHIDGSRDPFPKPPVNPQEHVRDQTGDDVHLFSPTGFLDDAWFHRSYWVWGRHWSSGCNWYFRAGRNAPAGRILVVGSDAVYGYGRKPEYFKWTTPLGYHLFGAEKTTTESGVSYITVEKSASLDPAGKPLSVEAWVRAEKPSGAVIARGGGSHGYSLFLQNGRPHFAVRVSGKRHEVSGADPIVGRWVHLAGVLGDDKQLKLFVDGKEAATAAVPGFIAQDPNQAMQIGVDLNGQGVGDYTAPFGFSGAIDEVRIWHRSLSAEDISVHAQAPERIPRKGKALMLAYSFEKQRVRDLSGNRNHGIATELKKVEGKAGQAFSCDNYEKEMGAQTRVSYKWTREIPFYVRAMVKAGDTLFIAGPPDLIDEENTFSHFSEDATQSLLRRQDAAFKGEEGSLLWAVSPSSGQTLAEYKLKGLPRWDGMIAAGGRLYIVFGDGTVGCYGGERL